MELVSKKIKNSYAVRISIVQRNKEAGSAYLYVLTNDLHKKPFGFIENVYVSEAHRGKGIGTKLVKAVIEEAKKANCYKIIGTSRNTSEKVHRFYDKLGFKRHGIEFRIDLE